ncbi:thioesterase II family protein [Streptomyces sp. HMX112]|uniref:thioesterase II family protein n=1 Tax=Streptomyces sp. HMX112 TaxID=3390850 RepID=UPI003A806380
MSAWIRNFHPAPRAGVRLFCFPHAGGAASAYFPFSAALSGEVEVLTFQYPGRQDRLAEPPPADLDSLVEACLAELSPYTAEPFAIFGHSMGAVIGYEVARRLESAGRARPAALFVSGRQAPSLPWPPEGLVPEDGPDDDWVIGEARRLGGVDPALLDEPELRRLTLPALRADLRAIFAHTHRPGPRLTCPLTALTGDRDPSVTVAGARAWHSETTGPFDLHVFPGGHFYLNDQLPEVTKLIATSLPE